MKVFSARKLDEALNDPRINVSGVAKVAKLNPATIRALRLGQKEPKFNTLSAIASALNKPIDFFLEEEYVLNQQRLALPVNEKGAASA